MKRRRRPTVGDHSALGAHFYRIGAYDLAVTEFREAARLLPDAPTPHYNLACACAASHREEEAIAELRRTLVLDPGHLKARLLLGHLAGGREESGAVRAELGIVPAVQAGGHERENTRAELREVTFPTRPGRRRRRVRKRTRNSGYAKG